MEKKQIDLLWRKWRKFVEVNTPATCKSFYLALIKLGVNPTRLCLHRYSDYLGFVTAINDCGYLSIDENINEEEDKNGNE